MNIDWEQIVVVFGGIAGLITLIGAIANLTQIVDFFSKILVGIAKMFGRGKEKRKGENGETPSDAPRKEILNNLPASARFVGRAVVVEKLCQTIDSTTLTAIIGQGGAGKSLLILETVKRYYLNPNPKDNHVRFDAIVWISAKDEPVTFESFLDTVARVLDYTGILQITDINAKAAEVEALYHKFNLLLIVDNFETITDERLFSFLKKACDKDRIVVTSRVRHNWRIPFTPIYLDKLELADALELISHECKQRGLVYSPESHAEIFERLYNVTGGIPLAIKWAIGQADVKCLPLSKVIGNLENGEGDVFETMFKDNWAVIDDSDKYLLYTLLFFTAPPSREKFNTVLLDKIDDFDTSLGKMISLSLIETDGEAFGGAQSIGLHPLTRSFVQKKFDAHGELATDIYTNLLAHYTAFCLKNGKQGTVCDFDEMEIEIGNVFKILEWAASSCDEGVLRSALDISDSISVFLWSRGYWLDRIRVSESAVQIAMKLNDYAAVVRHYYYVGIVKFWQGLLSEADVACRMCRKYVELCNDKCAELLEMRLSALIGMYGEEWQSSVDKLSTTLDFISDGSSVTNDEASLFADWRVNTAMGYKAGMVALMQECGITYNRHNDYENAEIWLKRSLDLAIEIGDKEGQAVSYSHLGRAYIGMNMPDKSEESCTFGLALALEVKRKSTTGRCYQILAEVNYGKKKFRKAAQNAEQAIIWFDKLGMSAESEAVKKFIRE